VNRKATALNHVGDANVAIIKLYLVARRGLARFFTEGIKVSDVTEADVVLNRVDRKIGCRNLLLTRFEVAF
jgi:hypothetical protein